MVEDPWRIFLTTDHPNGGPFTAYPHLLRLLMDRSFRLSMLERVHPVVREHSRLAELSRQYSLEEVAIVTRAAPARILGLSGLGSLAPGCYADLAAYPPQADWEATFSRARHVFKSGVEIVRDGQVIEWRPPRHHWRASVEVDAEIVARWSSSLEQRLRLPRRALEIGDEELPWLGDCGERFSRAQS